MTKKDVDMLNGSLYKSVIKFSLPVMATNILSQLFHNVDMIVVGRFCGSKAVGAVGATSSLVSLVVSLFIGLSTGAAVIVAQSRGSGDENALRRVVHTTVYTSFFTGVVLTVTGLLLARPLLGVMGTPHDIIEDSALYLKIYFAGIILRMAYVFGSAVLRAVGDSRSPFRYLTIGGALNVVFNLFFVTVCKMSVDGVAWGTVISEGFSGLMCLRALTKRTDASRFTFAGFKKYYSLPVFLKIVKLGVPAGIENSLYAISNVMMQSSVNAFGSAVVAGSAAAGSIDNLCYLAATSFGAAASVFMGQNWGAKKLDRIKKLPAACFVWMSAITVFVSALLLVFSGPLVSLFIKNDPEAHRMAMLKLMIMLPGYIFAGLLYIHSGMLRGLGHSFSVMVISVMTICVFRVAFIYVMLRVHNDPVMIFTAYPASYILAAAAMIICYYPTLKKEKLLYLQRKRFKTEKEVTV